jgi:hypothetical protein
VDKPWPPFGDDDDRRRIEHGWIKESKQPWSWQHPPQKTARAGRVHVICTVRLCAWATASRRQAEQDGLGKEPVGWQRWRRQLLEKTRDDVIVFARDCYGIFHLAEYTRFLGGRLQAMPPGLGTRQDILAT